MSEYSTILERARDQFPAPEMPLDALLRRRDRKQRNRRLGTVVLALAVAAAAIGGLVRVFHLAEALRPASLPSTSDTWSRVIFDPGGRVNAISGGPAGLVAVGSEDDSRAAVWTSPDGRTWSRVSDLGPGDIRDVTAGGPGFVAVEGEYSSPTLDAPPVYADACPALRAGSLAAFDPPAPQVVKGPLVPPEADPVP